MRALSLRVFLGLALSAGLWVLPATGSPVTRLGAPGCDGEPGYALALSAFLGCRGLRSRPSLKSLAELLPQF